MRILVFANITRESEKMHDEIEKGVYAVYIKFSVEETSECLCCLNHSTTLAW